MGIIIGKFRKKKSTYDILEKLEQEITYIEEFGKSTEQTKKKIIGRFILLAILVYLILAFALYIYYHKICANQTLLCATPLIAFPVIIWVVKCFLTWYYSRKIRKNKKKLINLKDEKKKILDNVMETETYKVAKKILDKFGNELNRKPLKAAPLESTPVSDKAGAIVPRTLQATQTATGLRHRTVGPISTVQDRLGLGGQRTPFRGRQIMQTSPSTPVITMNGLPIVSRPGAMPGSPLPLPRSILPRDRSVLERMLDLLVGDGPSNRYALICRKCNSHNGMALKEEFEYLSFRCCYCSTFNPARKKKPTGPKFSTNIPPMRALCSNLSDSDPENSTSDSDTESTKRPELLEPKTDTIPNSDGDNFAALDGKVSASETPPAGVDEPLAEDVAPGSPMEVSDAVQAEEPAELFPTEAADTVKKPEESDSPTLVG